MINRKVFVDGYQAAKCSSGTAVGVIRQSTAQRRMEGAAATTLSSQGIVPTPPTAAGSTSVLGEPCTLITVVRRRK